MPRTPLLVLVGALVASAATLIPAHPAGAIPGSYDVTQRVSIDATGEGGATDTGNTVLVDASGRYVFFNTESPLVPEDTDGTWDAYRFDRLGNRTEIVSVEGPVGADAEINDPTRICGVSRNGRYVGLAIEQSGLVQVWQHDLLSAGFSKASESNADQQATKNGANAISPDWRCPVSNDGRYIAFQAQATNLVAGNTDTLADVYRHDVMLDTVELVSTSSAGVKGDGVSGWPSMSADGSAIAFASTSTNLAASDTNAKQDIFLRLPGIGSTLRMSVKTGGGQIMNDSANPSISANGNFVAFQSTADQIVALDNNGVQDVFLRNRTTGSTAIASLTDADTSVTGDSSYNPAVSDDGRYVSFGSLGKNLPGDLETPDEDHMYRRDMTAGATVLLDIGPTGNVGDDESYGQSISADGRVVAFASKASNLDQSDNSHIKDAFVRDLAVSTTPFDDSADFVAQQFPDFIGKPATGNDLEIWVGKLRHGKASLESIVDDLAHSPEFSAKRGPLVRLYWAYFFRPPDTGGLNYWTKKLTTGSTLAWVSEQFAKSSEFQTKYGSLSNNAFVTLIYQNIFEREPDAGGLAYWTGKLDKKQKTRGQVMVNFSESSEGKRFLAPQVDTILIWFGMLTTAPSKATAITYRDLIRNGEPAELVAHDIRSMPAYINRVS